MSLLDRSLERVYVPRYAFCSLFDKCTMLVGASKLELPATTLADYCYYRMFLGCTGLTSAPELPVTTMVYGCYDAMFQGCSNLTIAPELPATTLADYCYSYMFRRCSKLNYIKMLATDISETWCLYDWVNGVSATGTFVKSSSATWDVTGISGVPSGWKVETK